MNNWSKENREYGKASTPSYANKHTTRFSKPIREPMAKQPIESQVVNLNSHFRASSLNNTPDPLPEHDDLLSFYQEHQEKRDAEIKKHNEEHKKSNRHAQNVPREIVQHKHSLPIYGVKDELIDLITSNQFVIVVGETGSGKSTQLAQYIAETDIVIDGQSIGITQPRRVAAKSLADRVAVEMGVKLGTSVGFLVRFESCVSSKTVIKYMTDGILVNECTQADPNLDSYSVIMIDEAHDRSIHSDVCLGLLKRICKNRPDLKVIISSATLEVEKFSRFFNDAPVLRIPGKSFDVEVIYEPSFDIDMKNVTDTIFRLHQTTIAGKRISYFSRGDILVFLAGQDEIETIFEQIEKRSPSNCSLELIVVPCYGTLPFEEQQKIFDKTPQGYRKIVLATNIAETSITIDGIVFVIDCGYVKERRYNQYTKIETLDKVHITKFEAIQRQGRAGRTQPGKCYRMYSAEAYRNFNEAPQPAIQRSNVDFVVLDLLAMGVTNPLHFEFIDPPPKEAIGEALMALQQLSALDDRLALTPLGRQMVSYPLGPPLAKVLIISAELGCSKEILKIASLLSIQHQRLFVRNKRNRGEIDSTKKRFYAPEGDHFMLLRVYDEWIKNKYSQEWCAQNFIHFRLLDEAEDIRVQLQDIMIKNKLMTKKGDDILTCKPHQLKENISKAFTAGYFSQLAKKKLSSFAYEKLGSSGESKDVFLHPSSLLFNAKPLPEWIIFHEVIETSKAYMIGAVKTDLRWIKKYSPKFFEKIQSQYPFCL